MLDTIEELRLVKGFDSAAINKLRPFVTVYTDEQLSQTAKININTAPKNLIAVLSDKMTDDLATRVLDQRKTTPSTMLLILPGFQALKTSPWNCHS